MAVITLNYQHSQYQVAKAMYNTVKYGSLVTGLGAFGHISNAELAYDVASELLDDGLTAKNSTNLMMKLHSTALEIGAKQATPVKVINTIAEESINLIWDE